MNANDSGGAYVVGVRVNVGSLRMTAHIKNGGQQSFAECQYFLTSSALFFLACPGPVTSLPQWDTTDTRAARHSMDSTNSPSMQRDPGPSSESEYNYTRRHVRIAIVRNNYVYVEYIV